MLKKWIAVGFVAIALGVIAFLASAAEDEPEDHQPPKDQAVAEEKTNVEEEATSDDTHKAADKGHHGQRDEWGPPGLPGQLGPGHENLPGGPRGPRGDRQELSPPGLPGMGVPGRGPFQDWASLEKNDPDMFKLIKQKMALERQTRDLADSYRQASTAKRESIKKEVEKLVDQQFEVRQQIRQMDLKRFEEELQRLRDAIERRNKARKEIVEKRVTELLGPDEDVGF
jgi:hypothetical protein